MIWGLCCRFPTSGCCSPSSSIYLPCLIFAILSVSRTNKRLQQVNGWGPHRNSSLLSQLSLFPFLWNRFISPFGWKSPGLLVESVRLSPINDHKATASTAVKPNVGLSQCWCEALRLHLTPTHNWKKHQVCFKSSPRFLNPSSLFLILFIDFLLSIIVIFVAFNSDCFTEGWRFYTYMLILRGWWWSQKAYILHMLIIRHCLRSNNGFRNGWITLYKQRWSLLQPRIQMLSCSNYTQINPITCVPLSV